MLYDYYIILFIMIVRRLTTTKIINCIVKHLLKVYYKIEYLPCHFSDFIEKICELIYSLPETYLTHISF